MVLSRLMASDSRMALSSTCPRGKHASRTADFLMLYIQNLHPSKSSVTLTALRASLTITMMMSASIQMCMCTCCCTRVSSGMGKLMI